MSPTKLGHTGPDGVLELGELELGVLDVGVLDVGVLDDAVPDVGCVVFVPVADVVVRGLALLPLPLDCVAVTGVLSPGGVDSLPRLSGTWVSLVVEDCVMTVGLLVSPELEPKAYAPTATNDKVTTPSATERVRTCFVMLTVTP